MGDGDGDREQVLSQMRKASPALTCHLGQAQGGAQAGVPTAPSPLYSLSESRHLPALSLR